MNKVYLVGILYDDFSSKGFDVVAVADTPEMAQKLARAYVLNNNNIDLDEMAIREWKVNIHNPIGKIESVECCYNGDDVSVERTLPFVPIAIEEKDIIKEWD